MIKNILIKKLNLLEKQAVEKWLNMLFEQVTGIKPDYFVAIDFDGFVKIIDSLGGVDIKS